MWNAMVPLYFSRWEERYRPLVEVERMNPEPLRQFNATPFDLRPELGRIDARDARDHRPRRLHLRPGRRAGAGRRHPAAPSS